MPHPPPPPDPLPDPAAGGVVTPLEATSPLTRSIGPLGPLGGLRVRAMALLLVVVVLVTAVVALAGRSTVLTVRDALAVRLAKDEAHLARERLQGVLGREMALAQQWARSTTLQAWLRQEDDPRLQAAFRQEAMALRQAFRGGTLFAVPLTSGRFHYADASQPQPRVAYRVSPHQPEHSWYYRSLGEPSGLLINVDFDPGLNVTQIWVNVTVRTDQGDPLGVVGTGIDLQTFLREHLQDESSSAHSALVHPGGTVIAHPDPRRMQLDLARWGEAFAGGRAHFYSALNPEDQTRARQVVEQVLGDAQTRTIAARLDSHWHELGVALLPELGWLVVSAVNLESVSGITPPRLLLGLLLAGGLLSALAALVLYWVDRMVLHPLQQLGDAVLAAERQPPHAPTLERRRDEIGLLYARLCDVTAERQRQARHLEAEVLRRTEALAEANAQLARLSITDELTGLFNRRHLDHTLALEWARSQRQGIPLAFIMLDVDLFKLYNDHQGHPAGDACLQQVAQVLQDHARRATDVAARYGGEEFVLLAPDTDGPSAWLLAERLRQAVEALAIPHPHAPRGLVTISLGVAATVAHPHATASALIQAADTALYQAKAQGRNASVLATQPCPDPSSSAGL